MSHTPGEWYSSGNYIYARDELGLPKMIARCVDSTVGVAEAVDNACLMAASSDMYDVCKTVASRPAEAQEIMQREGFVIDDLDDRWQKFAFTLYTKLVQNATEADAATAKAKGEQP